MNRTKAFLPSFIFFSFLLLMVSSFFSLARFSLSEFGYEPVYQAWSTKLWPASLLYLLTFGSLLFVSWKKGVEWVMQWYWWATGGLIALSCLIVSMSGLTHVGGQPNHAMQILAYWPYAQFMLITQLVSAPVILVFVWAWLVRVSSIKDGLRYFVLFALIYWVMETALTAFVVSPILITQKSSFFLYSSLGLGSLGGAILVFKMSNASLSKLKETPNARLSFKFGQFPSSMAFFYFGLLQALQGFADVFLKSRLMTLYQDPKIYSQQLTQLSLFSGSLIILFAFIFGIGGYFVLRAENGFRKGIVSYGIIVSVASLFSFIYMSFCSDVRVFLTYIAILKGSILVIGLPLLQILYLKLKKEDRFSMQVLVQILLAPVLVRVILILMGTMTMGGISIVNASSAMGVVCGVAFFIVSFLLLRKMSGKHRLEA